MKIAITGGNGRFGRVLITHLAKHGHTLLSIDQSLTLPEGYAHPDGVSMAVDTLQDRTTVQGLFEGCDAVMHLAAFPSPMAHPPEQVYANNTLSSYNVLLAAAALSIRKVCLASSINAIGGAFSHKARYDYLPVDEQHPTYAEDAYSLSKWVLEAQADATARLHPEMSIASMRFHGLNKRSFYPADAHPSKLPQQWSHRIVNHLWGYADIDSAAKACILALQAEFKGHEVFFIVSPTTMFPTTVYSRELAEQHYATAALRAPLDGNAGLYDCSKAQRLWAGHMKISKISASMVLPKSA